MLWPLDDHEIENLTTEIYIPADPLFVDVSVPNLSVKNAPVEMIEIRI